MSEVFEQVMAQCARGCFTGLLRIRTRSGRGEIRFLSGIQDEIRFDALEGDPALARLQAAEEPEFEAIQSLPSIEPNGTTPVPIEGGLDRFHAAQLMRYCEANSLTCALELEALGRILTARYRLGELLSLEPDSELTAQLAEAKQGTYRFRLPRFELPANARQTRSATAPVAAAAPVAASPARNEAAFAVAAPGRAAAGPAGQAANRNGQRAPLPGLHSRPTPVATPAAHARHTAPTPVSVPGPRISPQALTPLAQPVAARAKTPLAAAASSAPAQWAAAPTGPAAASASVRPPPRGAQPATSPFATAASVSPAARSVPPPARPAAALRAQDRAPEPIARPIAKADAVAKAGPVFGASLAAQAAVRAPQAAEPAPARHRPWLAVAVLIALALAGWVAFGAHLPG